MLVPVLASAENAVDPEYLDQLEAEEKYGVQSSTISTQNIIPFNTPEGLGEFKVSNYGSGSATGNYWYRGYKFNLTQDTNVTHLIGGGTAGNFDVAIYSVDTSNNDIVPTSILGSVTFTSGGEDQLAQLASVIELERGVDYILAQGRASGSGFHYYVNNLAVQDLLDGSARIDFWEPQDDTSIRWGSGGSADAIVGQSYNDFNGAMPKIGFLYETTATLPNVTTLTSTFEGSDIILPGRLNDTGGGITTLYIEYGLEPTLSDGTLIQLGITEDVPTLFNHSIEYDRDTTYYYRAVGINEAGRTNGEIRAQRHIYPTLNVSDGLVTLTSAQDDIVIDPEIEVNYESTTNLSGARVIIENNFDPIHDILEITENHGITTNYDSATGILSLSGDASAQQYQEVLRTATYKNTRKTLDELPRTITFSLVEDLSYSHETGYYYEYVSDPGIDWHDARDAAELRNNFGMQGYLATVMSQAENEFLAQRLQGAGWIGASDEAEESIWRWVTGPEGLEDGGQGLHFYTQTRSQTGNNYGGNKGGGGFAIDSLYNNWANNEPNNWNDNEDKAHFCFGGTCPDGQWNDYSFDNNNIDGYVVKYGGMPDDENLSVSGAKTINLVNDEFPTAKIVTSTTVVGTNASIVFDGTNSSDDIGITNYHWDFGDTNTDNQSIVEYNYTVDGNYTVTLTVNDTANQQSSAQVEVTVIDGFVLVANAGSGYVVDEGTPLTLNASASEASSGITNYTWSLPGNINLTGETPEYTFEDPGNYTINLTINDGNYTTSTSTQVVVNDITPPTPVITANQTVIAQGDTIEFDATSSSDNVEIAYYEWDLWGNGYVTSTDAVVQQEYVMSEKLNVTLTVYDTSGNSAQTTQEIEIQNTEPPLANAGGNKTVKVNNTFLLNGSKSVDNVAIDSYVWNVSGEIISGSEITYMFNQTGTYDVSLNVTDTSGNSAVDDIVITVESLDNLDPRLNDWDATSSENNRIKITLDVDELLSEINVTINDSTLSISDFSHVHNGLNNYTYTATYSISKTGDYNVTVNSISDNFENTLNLELYKIVFVNFVAPSEPESTSRRSSSSAGVSLSDESVTSSQTSSGASRSIVYGQDMNFEYFESSTNNVSNKTLRISSFNQENINLDIEGYSFSLGFNESYEFDFDGDGVPDVLIRYDGRDGNSHNVFVQQLSVAQNVKVEDSAGEEEREDVGEESESQPEVREEVVQTSQTNWFFWSVIFLFLVVALLFLVFRKKKTEQ